MGDGTYENDNDKQHQRYAVTATAELMSFATTTHSPPCAAEAPQNQTKLYNNYYHLFITSLPP